jgi:hypothetical protein
VLLYKSKVVPVFRESSKRPWRRMGEWKYSFPILGLGTRWKWVISFTPLPLYPRGNNPQYPLDRRLGGPRNREKSFAPAGNRTPDVQPLPHRYPDTYCYIIIIIIIPDEVIGYWRAGMAQSVHWVGCGLNDRRIAVPGRGDRFVSCPQRPDGLWDPLI